MKRLSILLCCSFVGLFSLTGLSCSGGGLNPVEGKVIYKGQPLDGALVSFHPKGQTDFRTVSSVGYTKNDGTFTLTTGPKDGAPAGEYVVTITCSREVKRAGNGISTSLPETEDTLQGAYSNRDRSQIHVTVKSGKNKLEPFDLK